MAKLVASGSFSSIFVGMTLVCGVYVSLAAIGKDRRVAFSLLSASLVSVVSFSSIGLLSFGLLVLFAGAAGWWIFPRFDRLRAAPSLTITTLFLSIVVVGMYGVFTTLRVRAGVYGGDHLDFSGFAQLFVRVATVGVTLASMALLASVGTWRALRRTVVAKSGRIDDRGFVHLVGGETGRADERAEEEQRNVFVLAWKTTSTSAQTYREDAGPDRYLTYEGDRASYVEEARRRAMFWHLVGLTACWAFGGPLVGFFIG